MVALNPSIDGGGSPNGSPDTKVIVVPNDDKKVKALLEKGQALLDSGITLEELQSKYPYVAAAMQQEYGKALGFIYSDPELLKLFSKALREGLTAEGFTAALESTTWWKDRSASQREYDLRAKDPAAKLTLDQRRQEIIDEMKTIAMEQNGVKLSDQELYADADEILRNHFNDNSYTQLLTKFVRKKFVDKDVFTFGGQAGDEMERLRKYANDMGVFMNDESIGGYVDKIFAEETTSQDVDRMIQESAIGYYSQFADRIKNGETVKSIVDPYRQLIASMLELPDANAVNFINGDGTPSEVLMQKALFGGENGKAMSLYDLQKSIKTDSRWLKTGNAKNEYASLANNIRRVFGGGY